MNAENAENAENDAHAAHAAHDDKDGSIDGDKGTDHNSNANDDDDDDDDDDGGGDDGGGDGGDSGNDNEIRDSQFGAMKIMLAMQTDEGNICKYEAKLNPPVDDYADYYELFMEKILGSILKFYLYILNGAPNGVKAWWEHHLLMHRETANGELEEINFPLRIRSVQLIDSNESSLKDVVLGHCHDAISRISDFLVMGSDWLFVRLNRSFCHTSKYTNYIFNKIGSRVSRRNRLLFSNQSSKHLNSKSKPILSKNLVSICSPVDDCFLLCIGLGLEQMTKSKLNQLQQTDFEFSRLRNYLRTIVAQQFDTSNCEKFPLSLHQIRKFQKQNASKLCLNIYGCYLDETILSRNCYKFFPVLIGDNSNFDLLKINLLITHKSENGTYHLNYISDYHKLLRNSHHYSLKHMHFCSICCMGYKTSEELSKHTKFCQIGEPTLIFPSRAERLRYAPRRKACPVSVIGVADVETGLKPSQVKFGPLSSTKGVLTPIMCGYSFKFLIHADKFPICMPIMTEGETCIDRLWKFLRFDAFYLNSILNQQQFPVRPLTALQQSIVNTATHCSNCYRFLNGQFVLHHCHTGSEPIAAYCFQCNAMYQLLEINSIWFHNLENFDALLLLQSLESAEAKRHIERIRVFAKESQKIIKIDLTFRCYCCFPDEVLQEKDLKELSVFSHREKEIRHQLNCEYRQKLKFVHKEIKNQRESSADNIVIEMREDDDDSDDDDDDDESYGEDEGDMIEINEPIFNPKPLKCKHHGARFHKRLQIKDSLMLIRGSLAKSLQEMFSTAIQPNKCSAMPNGHPQYPDNDIWLGDEPKSCSCCLQKHAVRQDASDICHFSAKALGSIKWSHMLLRKLPHFPYSVLNKGITKLRSMQNWPSMESFENSLKDNENISLRDYESLKANCSSMGIRTSYDLLIFYLSADLLGLCTLIDFSHQYLFKEFNMNLLRFLSISRYGYDLILRTAQDEIGEEGIEYVTDERLYNMNRKACLGGFMSVSSYGKTIVPNVIYSPEFDPHKPQSVYLNVDIASHYGSVLLSSFSYSNYRYFDEKSGLVQDMNNAARLGKLPEFCNQMRASAGDLYILLTVVLHFPPDAQLLLKDFVPIISKRKLLFTELGFSQRAYCEKMDIPFCESEINIQDFSQQTCTLTIEYIQTLLDLGISIVQVDEACTASRHPIFAPVISKMLQIKNTTTLAFRRNWIKVRDNAFE